MLITISARHMTLGPQLRERAESALMRAGRLGPDATAGQIVFDIVAGLPWVELRLHRPGASVLMATATGSDHRTALDVADAKLRRQLHRRSSRLRSGRHQLVG